MPYNFLNAGMLVNGNPPNVDYINLFQETLNRQFANASNYYTIEEETTFASGVYADVEVRLTSLVNPTTGDSVEADFKRILFRDITHSVDMGRMFRFDNNYWMTVNVDRIKSLAQTVTVKRMNNSLRWIDELTGAYYTFPCSVQYLINENRDYATAGSALVVPSGIIQVIAQANPLVNKIEPNQRFLFGNADHWTAFRVEGGGLNNFDNQTTLDNSSAGFIRFTMATDYLNSDDDDLINGIANLKSNVYEIALSETSISGNVGQEIQLIPTVTLNGATITTNLSWSSSDEDVATVANGLVTFISDGTAIITCQMENNSSVYKTCGVTVGLTPVDTYQVVFHPIKNRLLEGTSQAYSVYLYKNTVQQADTFSFTLNAGSVPSDNYVYLATSGNSFIVQNLQKFLTGALTVTATSGVHSESIQINLAGLW